MSGAPNGRVFDVVFNKGTDKERTDRFEIKPMLLSDANLSRMKQLLIKRRRDVRRQAIEDWKDVGRDLPKSAHEAMAKEFLADAKTDLDIPIDAMLDLLRSGDREAMITLIWSCCPEIKTFQQATEVVDAHGNMMELFDLISDVLKEETEAQGN